MTAHENTEPKGHHIVKIAEITCAWIATHVSYPAMSPSSIAIEFASGAAILNVNDAVTFDSMSEVRRTRTGLRSNSSSRKRPYRINKKDKHQTVSHAEERARRVNSYTRSGRPIARRLDIEPKME